MVVAEFTGKDHVEDTDDGVQTEVPQSAGDVITLTPDQFPKVWQDALIEKHIIKEDSYSEGGFGVGSGAEGIIHYLSLVHAIRERREDEPVDGADEKLVDMAVKFYDVDYDEQKRRSKEHGRDESHAEYLLTRGALVRLPKSVQGKLLREGLAFWDNVNGGVVGYEDKEVLYKDLESTFHSLNRAQIENIYQGKDQFGEDSTLFGTPDEEFEALQAGSAAARIDNAVQETEEQSRADYAEKERELAQEADRQRELLLNEYQRLGAIIDVMESVVANDSPVGVESRRVLVDEIMVSFDDRDSASFKSAAVKRWAEVMHHSLRRREGIGGDRADMVVKVLAKTTDNPDEFFSEVSKFIDDEALKKIVDQATLIFGPGILREDRELVEEYGERLKKSNVDVALMMKYADDLARASQADTGTIIHGISDKDFIELLEFGYASMVGSVPEDRLDRVARSVDSNALSIALDQIKLIEEKSDDLRTGA